MGEPPKDHHEDRCDCLGRESRKGREEAQGRPCIAEVRARKQVRQALRRRQRSEVGRAPERRGPGAQEGGSRGGGAVLCQMQPWVKQEDGELPIGSESIERFSLGGLGGRGESLASGCLEGSERGASRDSVSASSFWGFAVRPQENRAE